jgi:hypothetical protein
MKALAARFFEAEHYLINSTLLLGAFGAAVDYLHSTPIPSGSMYAVMIFSLSLKGADYLRAAWQRRQAHG